MATRWKALDVAPALVEKARALWDRVGSRGARVSVSPPAPEEAPPEIRLPVIERRLGRLEEEAAASFEVVASIAQQHSQLAEQHAELVRTADLLLARSRALSWAAGVLALACMALLAIVIGR